ncbi:hypothetical protein FE257_001588 [Aspergillus nanangensis]|uniref:C2H2-type domain-containing protein n=1 Tax=Aspergillus nanangensis TaxID=2582783 RepID=A0AAD4CTL1_ASPNN|nr:hypothetical protein FE257_001588 [Aspergillus nanangensis]
MSEPKPNKCRCTYSTCKLVFNSVNEMISHKKADPDHFYCARCKEDLDDDEHLLIHKIKSDNHIVCPMCGIGFGSEGGRDAHIRQNHRSKQDLKCFGCKVHFSTASGLMRHVEQDECPVITPQRVLQEQSKKMLIKEVLATGEGLSMPAIPSSFRLVDMDGGVRLETEASGREALMNQPFNSPPSTTSAMLTMKHWPTIESTNSASSDLIDMSETELTNNKSQRGWHSLGSQAGSVIESNPRQPFSVGIPEAGQTIRAFHRAWDPTNFFDSFSGDYVCPCGRAFVDMKDFEQHVLAKSQMCHQVQCPGCQKIFKSTSALVAHCESGSNRCDIANTNKYGQMIDELTGGVVQLAGYNPDGTIKYAAGELELEETTALKRDRSKVKW